ncbi:MAG TPA: pantoate--beta-alanine ligase [Acidimicrobiales bacterium]|nr:pantoate--beta-alanine ligase [Acidimicrobiales bacterium]
MIVTTSAAHVRDLTEQTRRKGGNVGLHPTMGALHGGHIANIATMAAQCDLSVVTVFVNPLQFGPSEDFDAYPRKLEADIAVAEQAGADVVFAPSQAEMYPEPPLTRVTVAGLSERWEGEHRPGHFDGVATVVAKLFAIAGPCWAYFGEKDYQQLLVVRRMVSDLSMPVVVVPCATVREPDGLALSSRNQYLDDEARRAAPVLYWSLLAGKRAIEEQGALDGAQVRKAMLEVLQAEPLAQVGYAAVVSTSTLEPIDVVDGAARLLVAARVGAARLIDNLGANEDAPC